MNPLDFTVFVNIDVVRIAFQGVLRMTTGYHSVVKFSLHFRVPKVQNPDIIDYLYVLNYIHLHVSGTAAYLMYNNNIL